jgi:4-hydroxy-L-threonine phosphate dehydrogenase PdxA
MKVYVSQGHERGIGSEVFLKSCLLLSATEVAQLELVAYADAIAATLQSLNYDFEIGTNFLRYGGISLSARWLSAVEFSQSFTALKLAMQLSEDGGVLFTLPTAKDQFPASPGHTEFFRSFYQRSDLGMFFSAPRLKMLLLTDHLPVSRLADELTEDFMLARVDRALNQLQQWNWPVNQVLISGLNPHAGEGGMIGQEDQRVTNIINKLRTKYKFSISGPWPGDTMVLEQKSPADLLVYLYHDQGLGVFKALQGFIGSNITLGLPYPRVSPDHGTSFSLYGKNAADYRGCSHALSDALDLLQRVQHGKNSSHQSQSSQSKKR